ncbi:hypothetical protein R3I93_016576 [Phoxinus phoxinus]|uniref:Uncharacterized protein n=1 Tax=Phoxinus phoxinus TaxID=58324 RepID=A0AAN9GZV2_9TELE
MSDRGWGTHGAGSPGPRLAGGGWRSAGPSDQLLLRGHDGVTHVLGSSSESQLSESYTIHWNDQVPA